MVAGQADGQSSLGNGSAFGLYLGVSSAGIGHALRLGISTVDLLTICDSGVIGTNGPDVSQGGVRHPRSDDAGDVGSRDGSVDSELDTVQRLEHVSCRSLPHRKRQSAEC
jgi:hypothetical protein